MAHLLKGVAKTLNGRYLKCFSSRLRNTNKGVDDGSEADRGVHPEGAAVAYPAAYVGERFDGEEQLDVGQSGR